MAQRRSTGLPAALVACGVLLASGCGAGTTPSAREPEEAEYRPGMSATVARPDADPTAVVVLVPGGGWSSADPSGLAPLADRLVTDGFATVTITYATSSDGSSYPVPVEDVACAASFAAAQVPDVPVVLLGHSAGAHLAALAALEPADTLASAGTDGADDGCTADPHAADAVVGLAGPYDLGATGDMGTHLMGVAQDDQPDLWRDANPLTWADQRPEVPFLLLHGDADHVVPLQLTQDFARHLADGGHEVTVRVLPGVDHGRVYGADVVGDVVVDWLDATVVTR